MALQAKSPNYAWAIGACIFMLGIVGLGGPMIWGFVAPFIAADFGVEVTDIAIGASMYNLTTSLLGFVVGMIGDRFGARTPITVGMIGMGTCWVLAGLINGSKWIPVIFYGLSGIFAAIVATVLLPKLVANWFAPNMRGKGMLLNTIGGSLTGMVFGIVLPVVCSQVNGWKHAFMGIGVILIIFGIIFFIFVRNTPEEMGTHALGYTEEEAKLHASPVLTPEEAAAKRKEDLGNIIKVLKQPALWIFSVSIILWFFYFIGMNTFQFTALIGAGYAPTIAGVVTTLFTLANMLGMLVVAPLSDRVITRKMTFTLQLLGVGIMFIIIYFYVSGGGLNNTVLFILYFILGVFASTAVIQQNLYGEVFPPNLRNVGPGMLMTIGTIGSAGAPLVAAAWIGAFNGNYVSVFIFCAVSAIAAGLIALALPKSGGKVGDPLLDKFLAEQRAAEEKAGQE